ncbi:triphosphoribosyl-dephospho-CoA synthase [Rhizobium sp. RAF56]|jgi:triphosphoribosyl-dephospho-CoA synthase|uniref:triphosphoribosyl-dephospho-CoA synthase n=1 Tax=Rhizobium sp. RAF56 TaxID=3233062 RepID=UPI003F9D8FE0
MTPAWRTIKDAYLDACRGEVEALKPGNVHRFADGHRMTADQFVLSAEVSAPAISEPNAPVGRRVFDAVAATREKVGTNTNLGIVLLAAPLAKAAEDDRAHLRDALQRTLDSMDGQDASDVFSAIRLANPGGLGSAEAGDVRQAPIISLIDAMAMAADRDMIARQYVTCFADIFGSGLTALKDAAERGETGMWPTVFTYLHFLSHFPDSHVGRKYGSGISEKIRQEAQTIEREVRHEASLSRRQDMLLDFDSRLKAQNINPGTSADLTVATLFISNMNFSLHKRYAGG